MGKSKDLFMDYRASEDFERVSLLDSIYLQEIEYELYQEYLNDIKNDINMESIVKENNITKVERGYGKQRHYKRSKSRTEGSRKWPFTKGKSTYNTRTTQVEIGFKSLDDIRTTIF